MTKSIFKQIFITLFVVLAFLLAQNSFIIGLFSNNKNLDVYADTTVSNGKHTSELTSKMSDINANFNSTASGSTSTTSSYYTGSTQIRTPSNWTKTGNLVSKLKIGVIDLKNFNSEEYGISQADLPNIYPESMTSNSENNVLMINTESSSNFGYTSSSIELSANSYYSITVNYYTKPGVAASIYLISDDLSNIETSKWELQETNGKWESVTFWISTSITKNLDLTIGLYIGSSSAGGNSISNPMQNGYVLFDNIKINQYSKAYYDNANKTHNNNQSINLKAETITSGDGYVEGGNFENGLSAWSAPTDEENLNTGGTAVLVDLATFESKDYEGLPSNVNPGTDYNSYSQTKALMFYSRTEATNTLESKEIEILQNNIYRISVWAKGSLGSGSVNITLSGDIPGTLEDTASQSYTAFTSNTNTFNNGWQEYVFYVIGNHSYDAKIKLSLGITDARGYVIFDDITSVKISSDDRTNGVALDSNAKTLELYNTDSATVPNGYFNFSTSVGNNVTYPLGVANWTKSGTDETESGLEISGIINTKSDIFNANKIYFDSPANPAQVSPVADDTNNILMLRNRSQISSYQSYETESTISLSASTYYRFNIDICTQDITNRASGINVSIINSDDVVLAQFNNLIINNPTTNNWQTLEVYFYTGNLAQEVSIVLSLGSETAPTAGFAYFDNCEISSNDASGTAITADSFTEIQTSNYVKKVDLSTESFDSYATLNPTTHLYEPLFWELECQEGQEYNFAGGILTNENIYAALGQEEFETDLESALMLRNYADTYSTAKYKLNYSFNANGYYKVTVKVKTIDLSQEYYNETKDEDGNNIPYGANIYIEEFEDKFTAINTASKNVNNFKPFDDEENVFVEYTFLINSTEAIEPTFVLSLGSENALVSGIALFDDFTITTITEDEYTNATAIYEDESEYPETLINIVNTSTTTEDEGGATFTPDYTVWLAIPTVIIAVAVIVAIVGFTVKKINQNKPEKVKVSVSYDRSETLLKDMDRRHRKSAISHRLKLLYEELETTERNLEQERKEHQKQQEAYQTAKEIAAQDKSIHLQEPDNKYLNFEKTEEELMKNIEGIKADIKVLEDEQKRILENEKAHNSKSANNIVIRKNSKK